MTIIIWDLSTYTSTITLGPLPEIVSIFVVVIVVIVVVVVVIVSG